MILCINWNERRHTALTQTGRENVKYCNLITVALSRQDLCINILFQEGNTHLNDFVWSSKSKQYTLRWWYILQLQAFFHPFSGLFREVLKLMSPMDVWIWYDGSKRSPASVASAVPGSEAPCGEV